MTQPPSVRLLVAASVFLALFVPASLPAQTQTFSSSVETSNLDLPDAPGVQASAGEAIQTGSQSTSLPAAQTVPQAPSPDSPTQQGAPAPATPPASTQTTAQQQHEEAERELQIEEKQRLLGIMPQFQVINGGKAVPLTPGEKWRLALHSAVDPFYIGWAFVIGGGYGELSDSDSQRGYGWGAPGYFKRVGSNYADNVNGALIGNALLPSLLHQDPRYFRKGTGSIKSRFVYAALSTVICHGDNGKNQFNASNVFGNFISGAISNAYYPADQRGLGLTLENGLDVTLFGALGGQLLEFGPDLAKLLHHKKHNALTASPATTTP